MTSSAYENENTIKEYMKTPVQGLTWSLVKYFSGSNTGVQRFIARSGSSAVVAFRGSESASDWGANVQILTADVDWNQVHVDWQLASKWDWLGKFQDWLNSIWVPTVTISLCTWEWGPGKVHCGFLAQFKEQKDDLDAQLDDLVNNKGVNDILITGHSLGGALSWLATYYIRQRYPSSNINVEVISFAAASNGDATFNQWIKDKIPAVNRNHVVYGYDPIPCVPPGVPEPSQIQHFTADWPIVTDEKWYSERKHLCIISINVGDHMMSNYCRALGLDGSPGQCPAAF